MAEQNINENQTEVTEEVTPDTVSEEKEVAEETTEEKTEKTEETEEITEETTSEAQTEAQDDEKVTEEKEKKGFFHKEKKKDKKDELIEELTDKYKRTFAEFDNFRKRSEKEKAAMYEVGARDIIEKILPVVDNFERGFKVVSEEEKATPFADGMDKIYKQLITTLNDLGVKEIEAEGKEFDPNLHNAVMHIEDEEVGENIIVEVFQKGYTYRDTVIRYSMVKVAN